MTRLINLKRLLSAALLALTLLASPAFAKAREWKISESSGQVFVEVDNISRPAMRGSTLKAGDYVITDANSRAVIVRGGEYVIVSPKSRIRIAKPKESGVITQIYQYLGSSLFKIEKKATPHFGVKTPYLAAVVKGTTFNVTVTENGATVQVTEGKVEVSTLDGGASDMIVPGRIARVDGDERQLLKVVGNNEREIRSSLPASALEQVAPAVQPSVAGSAGSDTVNIAGSNASQNRDSDESDDDDGSYERDDFSGAISAPVGAGETRIALLTGGLVVAGTNNDRDDTVGQPRSDDSANSGAGNASGNSENGNGAGAAGAGGTNGGGSTSGSDTGGSSGGNDGNTGGTPANSGNGGNAGNAGGNPPANDDSSGTPSTGNGATGNGSGAGGGGGSVGNAGGAGAGPGAGNGDDDDDDAPGPGNGNAGGAGGRPGTGNSNGNNGIGNGGDDDVDDRRGNGSLGRPGNAGGDDDDDDD
jgi:FecR protein